MDKDFKFIPKFRRCVIQNFPFIEEDFDALTDYGLLSKIVEYLNAVIASQNEVTEEVEALYKAFVDLKNYVDNYFDSTDFQELVNNKLDDMAESGELATIITEIVDLGTVFGYNTISDMASAENLVAGSICRVLGNSTATTGDGAFYLVRAIDPSDTPDGVNLVAIGETLVAVRIPDAQLDTAVSTLEGSITTNISAVNNRIDHLNDRKYVFVGDSYGQGYNPDGNVTGWTSLLKTKMGLNDNTCTIIQEGGAGFANASHKYEDMIANATADDAVTDVLICGGYNDLTYDKSAIYSGMSNTKTAILAKYPNVKNIYVGFIGGCTNDYHGDIHVRNAYYINACNGLNVTYLPNLQYVLYRASYFGSDGVHPNSDGQSALANAIYEALHGGYNYSIFEDLTIDTTESDHFGNVDFRLHIYSNNNVSNISSYYGTVFLTANSDFALSSSEPIKLGKITQNGVIGTKYYNNLQFNIGNVIVQSSVTPNGYYNMSSDVYIDEDGIVWIKFRPTVNDDHDNYQTFGGVHQLQIPPFTITYPTDSM